MIDAVRPDQRGRDLARERLAAVLAEQRGILREARAIAERLDDRHEVADRDALGEQRAQHAMHLADREQVGHELLDRHGVALLEPVEQQLGVLAREQLVGVLPDGLGQVRDDHRGGVDDRVARGLGSLARGGGDPEGGQAEGRLDRRDAVEGRVGIARIHREQAAGHELAARDLGALDADRVAVRRELDVVADADRGEHQPELRGHLTADERDPLQQLAPLALVDERDQAVADLELEDVERQRVPHRLRALQGRARLRRLRLLVEARDVVRHAPADGRAEAGDERADEQERQVRHAGHDARARRSPRRR